MKRLSTLICAAVCALAQTPPSGAPAAPPAAAPQLADGLYAILDTQMGKITARLFEDKTPITVKNFVGLATGTKAWKDPKTGAMVRRPLYANIGFHRIMMDQMIQTGSAVANGDHDCGFAIKGEVRPDLQFDQPGRLAMANTGRIDTGACQFFITAVAAPPWNGGYTIFGQVVDGQSVVKEISRVPQIDFQSHLAKNPPKLIGVTIKRVGPDPAAAAVPAPAKKSAAPPAAPGKK
jgi:cyclophilin family peptidyl-prolyl cis-trans isomerase